MEHVQDYCHKTQLQTLSTVTSYSRRVTEELRIFRKDREEELSTVESVEYYYYYCHHHRHHHPNSLLHSSSAVSQNSAGVTDQTLLIHCSAQNFLAVRHVLSIAVCCVGMYRAG